MTPEARRETLKELIDNVANSLNRIACLNRSVDGRVLSPALKKSIDDILRFHVTPAPALPPSATVARLNMNPDEYTKGGKAVLEVLDELEASKRMKDRQRVVYWAGQLAQVTGELAAEYLTSVAQDIAVEKMLTERKTLE